MKRSFFPKEEFTIGQSVGCFTYLREAQFTTRRKIVFRCFCGNEFISDTSKIRSGRRKSCGCAKGVLKTKHGMTESAEYRTWCHMKARCNNPSDRKYHLYGARGIKVCDRWLESFENFFEDMGYKPSQKHSLDRIEVNGDYEPNNCKWSTNKEQCNNKRNNVILNHNGLSMNITQWSEYLNIPIGRIQGRLKNGWIISDILDKPLMRQIK